MGGELKTIIQGNSLIIGNTSQLCNYFPSNYHSISSRNINIDDIKNNKYDTIYILFAEQRTFLNEKESFYTDVNFNYTIKLIDSLKNYSNRIIVYSTSELWNDYEGKVSVNMQYKYNYTPYIKSKEILCNYINEHKEKYLNVNIVYPFNFNSPFRKEGFLFSKIFNSIIDKKKCEVGDLNFNRDIIHPSIIVNESINSVNDVLVGGGSLINIKKYVLDLFSISNMDFYDYIIENPNNGLKNVRKEYYSEIKYSNYSDLLNLTINDIRKH
jgi:nucleoside-diphosphate-sugar epimerase